MTVERGITIALLSFFMFKMFMSLKKLPSKPPNIMSEPLMNKAEWRRRGFGFGSAISISVHLFCKGSNSCKSQMSYSFLPPKIYSLPSYVVAACPHRVEGAPSPILTLVTITFDSGLFGFAMKVLISKICISFRCTYSLWQPPKLTTYESFIELIVWNLFAV